MVPRIYSQNKTVRLSTKLLFLSKLKHLKKLTALVAFVSIFSFQGYSQCPAAISVECESDAFAAAEAAVDSGCTPVTVGSASYVGATPATPVCSGAGVAVTVRVLHGNGGFACNFGSAGFCDVSVNITGDATGPTFDQAPGALDINEQCAADVTLVAPTATDNCGGTPTVVVFSDNTVAGVCSNDFVRTVVYRATDDCTNTSDYTVTITVDDNMAPTIDQAPGALDATFTCNADLVVPAAPTATDNCMGNTVTVVLASDVTTPGACANQYSRVLTYNANDGCGNTSPDYTVTLTVNDNVAPTFDQAAGALDDTFVCAADLVVPAAPTATDNCAGNTVTVNLISDVTTPGVCANDYVRVLTYNAEDDCGNTSPDYTVTLTVNDNVAPTGGAPGAITIPSSESVCLSDAEAYVVANYPFVEADIAMGTGMGTGYSDNCSTLGASSIVLTATTASGDNCGWDVTYTFNVVDECGNVLGDEIWVISGEDTEAPTGTAPTGTTGILACLSDASTAAPAFNAATVAMSYSDVCGMVSITNMSSATAGTDCSWTVTYTYDVEDDCGNTLSGEQIVHSGGDTQAPTWTTPLMDLDRTIECSDAGALATAQALFPVATDNCDADVTNIVKVSGAFVPNPGTCNQATGTYTNTWTVTDDCTNTSVVYTQVITLEDTTAPTWTTAAGALDVTLECNDGPGIAAAQAMVPVAMDNCDSDVTNVVKVTGAFVPSITCPQAGTATNTFTVTDDCGNTSAVFTQVITIVDTQAPTWTTPVGDLNATVDCDDAAALAAAQAMAPVATDNCDSDVTNIVKFPGALVPSSCPQAGTITNIWRVTDDCGNTSMDYEQVITVEDNDVPTFTAPADITISTSATDCTYDATVSNTGDVTNEMDNCDMTVDATFVDAISMDDPCVGSHVITRTWSLEDACGNAAANQVQTITVQDNTNPTADPLTALAVQCIADVPAANIADVTGESDFCSTVTVAHTGDVSDGNTCPETITRTYSVTDDCGNSINVVQTIVVDDTTNPTASNPAAMTVQCYPAPDVTVVTDEADNCTATPIVTFVMDVSDGNTCPEVIMRTYRVTDDCDNTFDVVQMITIDDTITPTGNEPAATSGHNSCLANAITTVQAAHPFDLALLATGYTDNCTSITAVNIDSVGITVSGSDCDWDVVYTYNVMDDCGNVIGSETWIHSGEDMNAPTGTAPTGTTGINACAADALTAAPAFDATAAAAGYSDDCNNVTATLTNTDLSPNGDCLWTVTYTFSVADDCGNTLTGQTITHSGSDQTIPTFTTGANALNTTLECSNTAGLASAQALVPSATDNCGGSVTVTETTTGTFVAGSCPNSGTYTNIFTAEDACGNQTFFTQVITIEDNTDPTWISAPGALSVALDCSDVAGLAAAQAALPLPNDNCSATADITIIKTAGMFNAGSCQNVGTYTNTFVAIDECTNSSVVYTQVITITDNNVPTWTTPTGDLDITLTCSDAAGLTTAQAMMPSATDNCSSSTDITITKTAGTFVAGSCPNAGTYTNTFVATDECGNMSGTFTQTITLTDNVAPTGTAPAGMTAVNDCLANAPAFNATTTAGNYSDDCGNVTATLTGTSSTGNDCSWTVTYTYSVTDDCGNSLTGETITHSGGDMTDPVIPAVADYSVNNAAGNCFQTVSLTVPAVTDNCGTVNFVSTTATDAKGNNIPVITPTTAPVAILPVGPNEITMNFTDACGNDNSITYTVTVLDNEAPVITCVGPQTVDYAACNAATLLVPDLRGLVSVSDNCGGSNTITQEPSQFDLLSDHVTIVDGATLIVEVIVTDNNANGLADTCEIQITLNQDGEPVPTTAGGTLPVVTSTCGPVIVDAPTAIDACGNTVCGDPTPTTSVNFIGGVCSSNAAVISDFAGTVGSLGDDSPLDGNCNISSFGTYTFTTNVSGVGTIGAGTGVLENINLDLFHTWVSDLNISITSPDGTTLALSSNNGFNGDNYSGTNFQDGGTSIAASSPPFNGTFEAQGGTFASTFDGENADGVWTLSITDGAAGDCGWLNFWEMTFSTPPPPGSIPQYEIPVGNHTIFWVYDDGFGNTSQQIQQFNISDDNIAPDLTCFNVTLELDSMGNATIAAGNLLGEGFTLGNGTGPSNISEFCITVPNDIDFDFDWDYTQEPDFDELSYSIEGTQTIITDPAGPSSQSGTESISLSAGETFCITLENDFIIFSIANITFPGGLIGDLAFSNWTANGPQATYNAPNVTDNCGVDFSSLLANGNPTVDFDCDDLGSNTISVTADDINGNTGSCNANVTIVDNIDPVFTGVPDDVTVDCLSIPDPSTGVTASDNCNIIGIVANETTTQVPDPALCGFYNYEITRTWSVSDQSGNTTTATQIITVEDIQAPIFATNNFPSTVTISASAGSCDALVSLELTATDVLDLPGCVSFANLTITNNGNGTGDADASGIYPVGSTPVTFTVTDPCGNSESYTVNVNVVDDSPPFAACHNIIVGIPNGQDSILIDDPLIALIDNGSFDNCSPVIELNVFPNVFYCSQIADGTQDLPITLAVSVPGSTDTTFCQTTITIQDNNDPVVTCVDPLIITLDANGTATATTGMLNGGIDDCSNITTIELVGNTTFDVSDIGTHPISDGITPTLQVTDAHGNVGTCTPNTLIITPPVTCITSADVVDNGEVEIPYTSVNFTNVIGFQFSMQVDDETVATFAQDDAANLCGAATLNVPNLSGINQDLICNGIFTNQISADGKVLSVSWFNTSPDPVSIPDGETLFNFRLDALGVVGDMTTFSVTGTPYANELTTKYGNDILEDTPPLCLDPIGLFEVGDNATLPITGNVSTWSRTRIDTVGTDTMVVVNTPPMMNDTTFTPILDTVILVAGQGLANASLVKIETLLPITMTTVSDTTDTDMTDANGDYSVQVANVPSGAAIDLVPRKNNPNWLNNGDVNSSDLFFIQQHIVNNIPFTSIYDYVAADVNQSGTITTLDLVLIQDVIVNPEISPIPSSVIDAYNPWRFIQKEYADMVLNPFDLDPSIALPAQPMAPVIPASEQNRTYNPVSLPMTDVDWVAVKVGQIFGGLNTSTLTINDADSRTGENFVMSIENQKIANGEVISIPVYAKDYAAFIAWQFTLEFDENYLAYEGIVSGAIDGFEENKLGLNSVEEGIIGAVWYGTPNAVNSDEVLFTLQFTALDDAEALSGLIDVTSRTVKSQSSLMSGATGEVSIAFFSPTVTQTTDFKLHQNRPNPFNGETLISFNLPEAGFAKMTISDISGRTLKVIEGDFAKGYNEVRIQSNDLSSTGVLYYQLESAEHTDTKKMIILE